MVLYLNSPRTDLVRGINIYEALKKLPLLVLVFFIMLTAWHCVEQSDPIDFDQLINDSWKLRGEEKEQHLIEASTLADSLNHAYGKIRTLFFLGYHYESTRDYTKADSVYRRLVEVTQQHQDLKWEVSTLIQLGQVLTYQRKFIEAEAILEDALPKSMRQPDALLPGYTHQAFALVYQRQGNDKEAIASYEEALKVFEEQEHTAMKIRTLNFLGSEYAVLNLFDLSSEAYLEAATLALADEDTAQYISAIYQSGINLIENEDYEEALNLGKKALALQDQSKDQAKYARIMNNIGDAYLGIYLDGKDESDYDSARYFMQNSLTIKTDLGDKKGRAFTLFNLGRLAAASDNDEAENYFLEAFEIWQQAKDGVNLFNVAMELGGYYLDRSTDDAAAYLQLADSLSINHDNLSQDIAMANLKAQMALKKSNLAGFEIWIGRRDSLSDVFGEMERTISVAGTEVRLQTMELKQTNAQLLKDRANQEKLARLRMWLMIILLGFLLVAIGFLWYIRKRNHQLDRLNQRIKKLKDTVLHSQSNAINLVSALLRLQEKQVSSDDEKRLLREVNGRVAALGGMTQLLYEEQWNHEAGSAAVNLKDYLEEIVTETLTVLPSEEVEVNGNYVSVELISNKALSIGLIINELIINFFKHAHKAGGNRLELSSELQGNQLLIQYKDNGPGINEKATGKSSFGSFMISSLVEDLKGKMSSFSDNGLYYQIKIPV